MRAPDGLNKLRAEIENQLVDFDLFLPELREVFMRYVEPARQMGPISAVS